MRAIKISLFSKILGIGKYEAVEFDEKNIYIKSPKISRIAIPLGSIIDFHKNTGLIWNSFIIELANESSYHIDGIQKGKSKSDLFLRDFEEEFSPHFYLYYLERFKNILSSIPQESEYWQWSHFDLLCHQAKKAIGKFKYRSVPPSEDLKVMFEKIMRLGEGDKSFHEEHNRKFLENELDTANILIV